MAASAGSGTAMTEIAIIGGGPKAAALAAKAWALHRLGIDGPALTVLEPDGLAAAWAGGRGYTDGELRLCTPADRDLGFPYSHSGFGAVAAGLTFAAYSWQRFLVSGEGEDAYAAWLDRGRPRPPHRQFADYLGWAIGKSGCEVVRDRVSRLSHAPAQGWRVTCERRGLIAKPFDAVVVTGSGPPLPPMAGADERVFNGKDFWTRLPQARELLDAEDEDASAVIIGAGGTAASVASWFVRGRFRHVPVRIIGREPTLYTRGAGFFENRLFADEEEWRRLPDARKDAFVERLTRGVVWEDVLASLGEAGSVTYTSGTALGFDAARDGELRLRLGEPGGLEELVPASLFVDCRGFDAWWFASLFAAADPARQMLQSQRAPLLASIDEALAFTDPFPHPGLHVPMLGSRIGPASGNLMALGWMSDRILRPYLSQAEVAQLIALGSI